MSIFSEIERPTHLKGGILGFAGSGKTTTMALIAIGLHKLLKHDKPVLFMDTETGSSYVKDLFSKHNVPILGKKSRAFLTLMTGLEEAVKGGNIFLTDSVTHYWHELMASYMKVKGISRLNVYHIGNIKKEWSPLPDLWLNSPIHTILCGRAGYKWGYEEDDEGDKQLTTVGTKMKVEGDFGYEPTLLIEMEQSRTSKEVGSNLVNRAWVIKDKFMDDGLQGKFFDMPTFENFMPHISRLNLNGVFPEIDIKSTSESIIASPDRSVTERFKQRDIYVEELKDELTLKFNARTDEGKKQALNFLKDTYGTTSMTAIENMPNNKIREGLDNLKSQSAIQKTPQQTPSPEEPKQKKGKKQ